MKLIHLNEYDLLEVSVDVSSVLFGTMRNAVIYNKHNGILQT